MNKSAETLAEEFAKSHTENKGTHGALHYGFIAGHQSRDEEVNKLVEVLGEIIEVSKRPSVREAIVIKRAKEALKPYLK